MLKIAVYFDLFLLYYIFEPVLHKLQILSGQDNLWWAKKWIDGTNVVMFIFALFLIISAKMIIFGVWLALLAIVVFASTSIGLWKFLTQKAGKGHLRHAMEREQDSVRYWALRGKRNLLGVALMRARMMNNLFVGIVIVITYVLCRAHNQVFIVMCTTAVYCAAYTVWLYIRSCTPLCRWKQKNKTTPFTKVTFTL